MTEPVIQVTDLVKRYGELEAVRGINFEVEPGETFGLDRKSTRLNSSHRR